MRWSILLTACFAAWPVARATGQISPGPLARAHATLEGSRQCLRCHTGGRTALGDKCLDCHKDIRWLTERRRGYHATVGQAACASCHPEHAGAAFDLIKWPDGSAESFDHARAGWSLSGRHAKVRCADCHAAKYRKSPAAALAADTISAGWTGLETTCATCHADPHRGALTRQCQKCHDAERWSSTPGFSHDRTRYPLTGKHAATKCNACHLDARLGLRADAAGRPVPRYRPLAFGECSSCHKDPHAARLGPKCAACHETRGWNVVNQATFDHERTRYPLRGAHRRTSCDKCHDFSGRPGARRSPAFAACSSCHTDVHRGQATLAGKVVDCSACHDLGAFTPARMTLEQHAATRYPLTGKHVVTKCAACHSKPTGGVVAMRPVFARCRDCHSEDPHRGPVTRDCRACHDTRGFTPSTVDVALHEAYFALDGAHRAVRCADCHKGMGDLWTPRATLSLTASKTCAGCHNTPHGTQFAARTDRGRCDACHSAAAWRPADRFDHERTAFSLKGGHSSVPCARCHPAARPVADRRYRPVSAKCESCHGKEVR